MAILDTLTEVGSNGSITSMSAPGKALGATSITIASTTNWPSTGKTVFFAIRTVNPSTVSSTNPSGQVANTYSEWKGIVGTNSISNLTLQLGSVDQVYTAGVNTQVFIPVLAPRENALVAWGQVSHDNIGNLLPNIVTAAKIASATITNAQIAAGGVNYANLLTSIFGGQVQTLTNTGTAGGSMSYINLGGIKLLWGLTAIVATSSAPTGLTVILPSSFFTTITAPYATITAVNVTQDQSVIFQGFTASLLTITLFSAAPGAQAQASYLVIGT